MKNALLASLAVLAVSTPPAAIAQSVFDLPIGDPARRESTLTPALDVIVATADGAELTPAQIAERLEGVRLLLIGESHTSMDFHRVQERVVRALQDSGRRVLIGLEMFPVTEQASLDRWNDGSWDEDEFVMNSEWYRHWGYNWLYYRDIFRTARAGNSPMYAVNAPRANVSAVRRKGFDGLTEEERTGIPPHVDTDSADHFTLFKAYFDDEEEDESTHTAGMTDEQWQAMFAAQCTWDGAMAWNAVHNLEADPDPNSIMVVMVGSGHVAYGLGIARQAAAYFDGDAATLIPVPMEDEDGEPIATVRGSYADFIWGVPGEIAPLYPSLGASLTETAEGLTVLFADPESLAGEAGITSGDRILTFDGWEVGDRLTFKRLMADLRWGDTARLTIGRGQETFEIAIPLRRQYE